MATSNSASAAPLHLAFDIGHASIGWAVLQDGADALPAVLGCGAVIFPPDDCLASKRRTYRRQRRHIRATRQRIERIARLLHHLLKDAPDEEDRAFAAHLQRIYIDTPPAHRTAALLTGPKVPEYLKPHPAPWLLAARVLAAQSEQERTAARLTWPRLWDLLRWYAHNRGYDGNRLWSKVAADDDLDEEEMDAAEEEANIEDAEKVKNARRLLEKFHKHSMAETIRERLHPGENPIFATEGYAYKTCDAAFPRRMVVKEVRGLLAAHIGHLHGVTQDFTYFLCADRNPSSGPPAWKLIECPGLKFPLRYQGGLLFGQMVPRFDNRIIGICPATGAKKPLKWCPEYLLFRWAQQVANVTVRSPRHPQNKLTAAEKQTLTDEARRTGGFTEKEFKTRVRELTGTSDDNLAQLLMHPDADKALVLDPARRFTVSNEKTAAVWSLLPERVQKAVTGRWRKGRAMSLAWMLQTVPDKEEAFSCIHAAAQKKQRKTPDWKKWLNAPLGPEYPSGRAPYCKKVMLDAAKGYLGAPEDDPRLTGGVLDPIKLRAKDEARPLDELTNNHLIRQRLRILEGDPQPGNKDPLHRQFNGLLHDIVVEYAGGDKSRVATCTVEVASDLQEFSGKDSQDKAKELSLKLKNFDSIVKQLHAAGIDRPKAGLIRKARVADDLDWKCPYTGMAFCASRLAGGEMDLDHIVPRSKRASDSLDSLAVTFKAVNAMKKQRTAWEFMQEDGGKMVQGMPGVQLKTFEAYKAYVKSLAPERCPRRPKTDRDKRFAGKDGLHHEDRVRRWRRAQRLKAEKWEREDKDFTPGDLTRSSHLMRLGAQRIARWFGWDAAHGNKPQNIISLPGQVTAEVRKAWHVTGCLAPPCPEVMVLVPDLNDDRTPKLDANGEKVMKLAPKPKKEIRDLTHLHHALDACVMGLTAALMPNHGKLWEQIANRKVREEELPAFHAQRRDVRLYKLGNKEGRTQKLELADLPDELKNQITARLTERRVVQRVPADMSGALLEETTWAIERNDPESDRVFKSQRTFDKKDNDPETGARKRIVKRDDERPGKLLGMKDGKLQNNLGLRVVAGNYGMALFHPKLNLEPEIIPHHQVWKRLEELRVKNGGRLPRILKNGMLIRVPRGRFAGTWRIFSTKASLTLDLGAADKVKLASKGEGQKREVSVISLLQAGLEILPARLTGVAVSSPWD